MEEPPHQIVDKHSGGIDAGHPQRPEAADVLASTGWRTIILALTIMAAGYYLVYLMTPLRLNVHLETYSWIGYCSSYGHRCFWSPA
ncbi:MAG TPA: hypothetical protein VKY31_07290 [Terriglobia bacterium]|nr:hypothetical protein [Terriglobia bacterium]